MRETRKKEDRRGRAGKRTSYALLVCALTVAARNPVPDTTGTVHIIWSNGEERWGEDDVGYA